ncbi:MAG: TatD family hydrolase [Minisyncoccia bacterium]
MIDTHCHLHSQEFDSIRDNLLLQIQNSNIKAILVGTSIEDSITAINLANDYNFLYASLGVHPHEYETIDLDLVYQDMDHILSHKYIVAIGECGLDFYYHKASEVKAKQEKLFRLHLDLALKYNKPVIIHTRDSFEDTYRILSEYKDLIIILHCFTGDPYWVNQFYNLQHIVYFSFSGIITFKNTVSIQESVKVVPISRLLVETDSPYLAPVPHRGAQNTPLFLKYNIDQISILRSIESQELTQILDTNAIQAFTL